jgi:hypothetical protein
MDEEWRNMIKKLLRWNSIYKLSNEDVELIKQITNKL